jgi:hypothetical protein
MLPVKSFKNLTEGGIILSFKNLTMIDPNQFPSWAGSDIESDSKDLREALYCLPF